LSPQNNNFGLRQFFGGYLLSEKKTISLSTVVACFLVVLEVPTHTSEDAA
jgi:hypothetical protein